MRQTIYEVETIKIRLKVGELLEQKANTSEDVYEFLKTIFSDLDDDQEHGILLSIDGQNSVRGYKVLFSGGQVECYFDYKIIFRNALLMGALGIIIAHNHPSGDVNPSEDDKKMTREMKRIAKLLGIQFLDHIIVGDNCQDYYSFTKKGIITRGGDR